MEDAHPRFPVALILTYKMSTHAKKKRGGKPSLEKKIEKQNKRKQRSGERIGDCNKGYEFKKWGLVVQWVEPNH